MNTTYDYGFAAGEGANREDLRGASKRKSPRSARLVDYEYGNEASNYILEAFGPHGHPSHLLRG